MSGRAEIRLGRLEEVVRRQSVETPGGYAAIALARRDGLLASASFLSGERLEAPRRSSVASITKPITASAVRQLVETGDVMEATGFDPRDPGPDPLPPKGTFPIEDLTPDELVALGAALTLPGGGLWSTPEDVATFGRALLLSGGVGDARILGPASIARMTRPETHDVRMFETGETVHSGLGLGLPGLSEDSPASRSAFGHTGATGSALLVDPGNDLVVGYLRNWWGVSMAATDEAIAAVYTELA